jgi:CHASE3 domain sensor protein
MCESVGLHLVLDRMYGAIALVLWQIQVISSMPDAHITTRVLRSQTLQANSDAIDQHTSRSCGGCRWSQECRQR